MKTAPVSQKSEGGKASAVSLTRETVDCSDNEVGPPAAPPPRPFDVFDVPDGLLPPPTPTLVRVGRAQVDANLLGPPPGTVFSELRSQLALVSPPSIIEPSLSIGERRALLERRFEVGRQRGRRAGVELYVEGPAAQRVLQHASELLFTNLRRDQPQQREPYPAILEEIGGTYVLPQDLRRWVRCRYDEDDPEVQRAGLAGRPFLDQREIPPRLALGYGAKALAIVRRNLPRKIYQAEFVVDRRGAVILRAPGLSRSRRAGPTGELVRARNRFTPTMDELQLNVGAGHSSLAPPADHDSSTDVDAVRYAGTLRFDESFHLVSWTNDSGHYQPHPGLARNLDLPFDRFIPAHVSILARGPEQRQRLRKQAVESMRAQCKAWRHKGVSGPGHWQRFKLVRQVGQAQDPSLTRREALQIYKSIEKSAA